MNQTERTDKKMQTVPFVAYESMAARAGRVVRGLTAALCASLLSGAVLAAVLVQTKQRLNAKEGSI